VIPSLVPAELKVLHGCYWRRENRNVTPRNKKRILKIGQVSCFFFFLVFSFGVVVFLLLKFQRSVVKKIYKLQERTDVKES
jgi:hypothetical protein